MKNMRKALSVLCVVALLIGTFSTVAFAATDVDYTITNPYATVDWSWEQYKADLHTHTTASDGSDSLKDMIEKNYDYNFDIYAVSDHGLTSKKISAQGDVYDVCRGSGNSKDVNYYMNLLDIDNDDHGIGVMLTAFSEMLKII